MNFKFSVTQRLYVRVIYALLSKFLMVRSFKIFFLFLMILFFSSSVFSEIEVFTIYDTNVKMNENENRIDVSKKIHLRNIHTVGIVPGDVEFKINHGDDGDGIIQLLSYNVTDRYGNEIKHELIKTSRYSVIALKVFTPILPGFEYIINLEYSLEFDSTGVIFKSFQIPLKENTRIPIQSGTYTLELPENYKLTYLSYEDNNTIIEKNKITWEIDDYSPENVKVEYSWIPLRFSGLQGSYLFWIIINIILFIILVREIKKELSKYREGEPSSKFRRKK